MDKPRNSFTELVQLEVLSVEGLVHHLLAALQHLNLTKQFLSKTLIGVTCIGASIMLGTQKWHCE